MGTFNRYDDADERENLPQEAFLGMVFDTDGAFEPNESWLKRADRDNIRIAMRAWFLDRYEDPAMNTPRLDGEFVYVYGGPFYPADVLFSRFSGIVDDDIINDVADELIEEVGDSWSPSLRFRNLDIETITPDEFSFGEIFDRLSVGIDALKEVARSNERPAVAGTNRKNAYAAAIGVMEAFLCDIMLFAIDKEPMVLQRLVEGHPTFSGQKLQLGDIFSRMEGLKGEVQGKLQSLVWHRWDEVNKYYDTGLQFRIDGIGKLAQPTDKRHDILHRAGRTRDGRDVVVDSVELMALCEDIIAIASIVEGRVKQKLGFT